MRHQPILIRLGTQHLAANVFVHLALTPLLHYVVDRSYDCKNEKPSPR